VPGSEWGEASSPYPSEKKKPDFVEKGAEPRQLRRLLFKGRGEEEKDRWKLKEGPTNLYWTCTLLADKKASWTKHQLPEKEER